jgi:hypothetical protein
VFIRWYTEVYAALEEFKLCHTCKLHFENPERISGFERLLKSLSAAKIVQCRQHVSEWIWGSGEVQTRTN